MEVGAAISAAFAAAKAFGAKLLFSAGFKAGMAAWGSVLTYGGMAASLLMAPPSLGSAVHQIYMQPAGPDAPIPLAFGETRTGGTMTYRDTHRDNIHNTNKSNNLTFESVVSAGPIHSIRDFKVNDSLIQFNSDPMRYGSATGQSMCVGVQGYDSRSRVFKEGIFMAYRVGDLNDTRTLRTITGQNYVPNITPDHRMSGLASFVASYILDGSKNLRFPAGPPDAPTVLVKGLLCYDPRKDSSGFGSGSHRVNDRSTWEWSDNPYLCALTYLLGGQGRTGKRNWGVGATVDQIDISAFAYGANVADFHGWKAGGVVTTSDDKEAVLANLLSAGAGQLVPSGFKIGVYVNEPKPSVFTIEETMLVGDQTIKPARPFTDRFNRIVAKYREPNSDYNLISGPAIVADNWQTIDGVVRSTEVSLPMVQSASQAQKMAAYVLVNSREYEVDLTLTADAAGLQVGDKVTLNFKIGAIEGQEFIIKTFRWNSDSQTIDLTLVSESEGKHEFALGKTATPPAPAAPKSKESLDPTPPTGWTITANQIAGAATADDATGPAIPAFVIEGAGDTAIQKIIVEVREFDDGQGPFDNWRIVCEFDPATTQLIVTNIAANTVYDVAVSYRSNMGAMTPRLVFDEVTSGGLTIDWNDDAIGNRPPVLTDLDEHNRLRVQYLSMVDGTSLADAMDDLQDAAATALDEARDARDNIANVATGLISTSLQIADEATRRETDDEVLSTSLSLLGEKNASGTAFVLDRDTVMVSDTQTFAQRDSLIESRFAGNASSYLLTTANAAASEANAAVTALTALGVDLDNAAAWQLDSAKIKVTPTETLADRLTSVGVSLTNKLTQTQVDARVDSKISASITPAGVIASHLQASYTSKADFNATAGFLSASIDGVAARASMFVDANGRIGGVNVGASQTRIDTEFLSDTFYFVDASTGQKTRVLTYTGGRWTFDANVRITGDLIVDGTIQNEKIEQNTITGLSAAYQASQMTLSGTTPAVVAEVWTMLEKAGSPVLIDTNCWLNLKHDASGSFTTYIDVRRSKDSGLGDQILLHQLDGSGMANDVFAGMVPFKIIDRPPSTGNWRYFVRVWSSTSDFTAQQCRARFISALEFKTNT